ncbi:MAG: undecaprenyl-phosphate glucose phosphotransferase [Azoarcus sp.]|jgi:putative colanic acid biosynthesis UDP-glucose lipid carrier transferase|nr:undecaprenyl-phosphate glucose phosphotransferase [Azoarcus sp.]
MPQQERSNRYLKNNLLRRANFTLSTAAEAFLYPIVILLTLLLIAVYHDGVIEPNYVVLGTLSFAVTFPGEVTFHDSRLRVLRKLLTNWLLFVFLMGAFGLATSYIKHFSIEILLAWVIVTPIAYIVTYFILRATLPNIISLFGNQRTAVIVGVNDIGICLAQQFQDDPCLGAQVLGFFDDRGIGRIPAEIPAPIKGRLSDLPEYVSQNHVDTIYLALPMEAQPHILNLLDSLKDTTASIYFVPDIFITDLIQGRFDSVGNMPVVAVCETPFTGFNGFIKRTSDIVLSIIILLLLCPLMLVLAAGVKLTSPGPVIFKQRRYGLDGKEILVYKFRSMTVCDDGEIVKQAMKDDDRVTWFGAFIRKTSLDELPQFVNVLQGRMSIVGPRPHAVVHNEIYRKAIKGYMIRHKVRPGITGWAQINGYRGETETIDKMEKRIEYDLEYLRNWSVNLDFWIIAKTALLVLTDRNAY